MRIKELRKKFLGSFIFLNHFKGGNKLKKMPRHKQTYLKDYQIECDSDIVSLIDILNKNGFKTFASCIGDRNERAYVMLEPDNLDEIIAIAPIFMNVPYCICELAMWVKPGMYRLVIRQNPSFRMTKSQ